MSEVTEIIEGLGKSPYYKFLGSIIGLFVLLVFLGYLSLFVWPVVPNGFGFNVSIQGTFEQISGKGLNLWQLGAFFIGTLFYIWTVIGSATDEWGESINTLPWITEDGQPEVVRDWMKKEMKYRNLDTDTKTELKKILPTDIPDYTALRMCESSLIIGSGYHIDRLPGFLGWLFKIDHRVWHVSTVKERITLDPQGNEKKMKVFLCQKVNPRGDIEQITDLTTRVAELEERDSLRPSLSQWVSMKNDNIRLIKQMKKIVNRKGRIALEEIEVREATRETVKEKFSNWKAWLIAGLISIGILLFLHFVVHLF